MDKNAFPKYNYLYKQNARQPEWTSTVIIPDFAIFHNCTP